ncbi:MAG: InlB B-repeat-containing protein, partial [Clostridia bacterium]|nr:InlB B-repeat-containing protein [Clostridia bacterium]
NFYTEINSTINDAEHGYYETTLKGEYYTPYIKTNSPTKQKNVFFAQNVDLNYNYTANALAEIKSVKVYRFTEDVTSLFDIVDLNQGINKIHISGSNVKPGTYKVVVAYSVGGNNEENVNHFIVCDGAEINHATFITETNGVVNNNYYLGYNNFNSGKADYIVSSLEISAMLPMNVILYSSTYSNFTSAKYISGYVDVYNNAESTISLNVDTLFGTQRTYRLTVLKSSNKVMAELRYNTYGGTNPEQNKERILLSQYVATRIYAPSKSGNKFLGWFLDPEFTNGLTKVGSGDGAYWELPKSKITIVEDTIHVDMPEKYGVAHTAFLYAKWESECHVSFDYNGMGGTNYDEVYNVGDSITEPEVVVPGDKKFLGWYTTSTFDNGTLWDFDNGTVNGDITLYAKWVDKIITITFNDGYDYQNVERQVEHGSLIDISLESFTERDNYEIEGWYTSQNYQDETLWDFDNDVVESQITLYAKWQGKLKTITYHFNNGTANYVTQARYGDKILDVPEDPSNGEHYTFIAWYYTGTFEDGTIWNFEDYNVDGNTNLYAYYEVEIFHITFYRNHNAEDTTKVLEFDEEYNNVISAPESPSRLHYAFGGWYTSKDCLADEAWDFDTLIDGNINLYAKWTQTQFEVTFCVSSEESYTMWENINTPIKVTNTSNSYAVWGYEDDGITETSFNILIEKYQVVGWYTDETLLLEWNIKTRNVTEEKTLYLKAIQNKFDVTFRLLGGMIVLAPEYLGGYVYNPTFDEFDYRYEKDVNDIIGSISVIKDGFEFLGWIIDGKTKIFVQNLTEYKVASDIVITAKWDLKPAQDMAIWLPDGVDSNNMITFTEYTFTFTFEQEIDYLLSTEKDAYDNKILGNLYADILWTVSVATEYSPVEFDMPYKFIETGIYTITATITLTINEEYYGEVIEYSSTAFCSETLYVYAKEINIDSNLIELHPDRILFLDSGDEEANYVVKIYKKTISSVSLPSTLSNEYTPKTGYVECLSYNTNNREIIFENSLTSGSYYAKVEKIIGDDNIGYVESEEYTVVSLTYNTGFDELNRVVYLDENTFVDLNSDKYQYNVIKEDYIFNGWLDENGNYINAIVMNTDKTIYANWDFDNLNVGLVGDMDVNNYSIQTTYQKDTNGVVQKYTIGVEIQDGGSRSLLYTYKWFKLGEETPFVVVENSDISGNYITVENVADSGTYYCRVVILDEQKQITSTITTNSVWVNIEPAETVLRIDQDYIDNNHYVYNGQSQEVYVGAHLDRNDDTVKIFYSLRQKQDNEEYPPKAIVKDSGEYTIYLYVPAKGNYKESTNYSFTVYVDKADSIIETRSQILSYTGSAIMPIYTINNTEQSVELSTQILNVGNYRNVSIIAPESKNYKRGEATLSIMVDPARITIKVLDVTSLWLFSKQELQYEIVSGFSGNVEDLQITLSSNVDINTAGKYSIDVNIGNENYKATVINGKYTVTALPHFVAGTVLVFIISVLIYLQKKKRYIYEFVENGGNIVGSIDVKKKQDVHIPIPRRDGYEFAGWYTDKALRHRFKNRFKKSRHKTLYAKWNQIYVPEQKPALDIDGLLVEYKIKKPKIKQRVTDTKVVNDAIQNEKNQDDAKREHLNEIIKRAQTTAPKRVIKQKDVEKARRATIKKDINFASMTEDQKLNYFINKAKSDSQGKQLDNEQISGIISSLNKDNN